MPAHDLVAQAATLNRFDVVGEHSKTAPGFIQHVALFESSDRGVDYGDAVDVVHMGPPFEIGGRLNAHVAGSVPLTNDQIKAIETWIETVKDEYQVEDAGWRKQYIIDPPWDDCRDKITKVRRYRRYSCAGFVIYAHLRAGVSLLMIENESLPEVTADTVRTAYPHASRHSDLLTELGLEGDGPWRIVLAGYVLRALNRTRDEILAEPYVAQDGDEFFRESL